MWRPVGSGVMPKEEVGFMVRYLFDGEKGLEMLERIDRRVDRLPGQRNLHLLTKACGAARADGLKTDLFDIHSMDASEQEATH